MTKEVRIGLLVAISILVFFSGFYFLKGSSLFSDEFTYHAFYENVQGLQPSAVVQIHGLKVGKVIAIKLNQTKPEDRVEVVMTLSKKTHLPKGTVAKLTSLDLLGNKCISLELGTLNEDLDDEATLPVAVEGGLMDKLSADASPLLSDVRKVVNNLDSVLNGVNDVFSMQVRTDLQQSIAALHKSMDNFSTVSGKMNGQSDALSRVIDNADKITGNLAKNNDNIDKALTNIKTTTEKLSNAPIDDAVKKIDKAAASLNEMIQKINNGDGSLGLLVNDKALYNNLNVTLSELGKLSSDLKAHPRRYINLNIIGRKAKADE